MGNWVTIRSDTRSGTIIVSVKLENDAEMAARIANGYAKQLEQYLDENEISKAKENRKFIEEQLKITERELTAYEEELKRFSERYQMLSPQEQLTVINGALAKFKTDLIGKEIEMRLLSPGSLKQRFLQDHIQAIRKEIAQLEHGSSEKSTTSVEKDRLFPVASPFPALTLQYLRLRRSWKSSRKSSSC